MVQFDDPPESHVVSWSEVHRDTRYLVRKLMKMGPWKGIIAVARGGLVPAAILAREMDIRVLDTICIATYDETDMGETSNVLKLPDRAIAEKGEGWLVVDDLVDTGTTFKVARDLLPQAHFATVYAKPQGAPLADTYLHDVPQSTWVYFPWDVDTQYTPPLAKQNQ